MKKIRVSLDPKSIDNAIHQIERYKVNLVNKIDKYLERLGQEGLIVAGAIISQHIYSGQTMSSLDVRKIGPNKYALVAESEAILFLEFGTGIRYSNIKHPLASKLGYGPGTFPGKGNWSNPQGWYYNLDGKRYHTFGQPASKPMYLASRRIIEKASAVAREVFLT